MLYLKYFILLFYLLEYSLMSTSLSSERDSQTHHSILHTRFGIRSALRLYDYPDSRDLASFSLFFQIDSLNNRHSSIAKRQ